MSFDDETIPTTVKSEKDENAASINEIGDENWVERPSGLCTSFPMLRD